MTQEALKLALEALELCNGAETVDGVVIYTDQEIAAIKEAIAELESQEPVAIVTSETGADLTMSWWHEPALPIGTKLYTHPPQRTEQEPVAWGFQNTAITGSNRWMMLREEVPANDQYNGALWTPLYTTPPQRKEPEQEPVAYIHRNEYNEYRLEPHDNFDIKSIPFNVDVPLFKSPQRKPLTDEEYAKLAEEFGPFPINQIEAKLKEENT